MNQEPLSSEDLGVIERSVARGSGAGTEIPSSLGLVAATAVQKKWPISWSVCSWAELGARPVARLPDAQSPTVCVQSSEETAGLPTA